MPTTISYTDTYRLDAPCAVDDLDLDPDLRKRLLEAVNGDDTAVRTRVSDRVEREITARLRRYGVTDTGEWLGDWSAAALIDRILEEEITR